MNDLSERVAQLEADNRMLTDRLALLQEFVMITLMELSEEDARNALREVIAGRIASYRHAVVPDQLGDLQNLMRAFQAAEVAFLDKRR
ncbi:hypothetical protein ROE7235_03689 [Roseibaca ekhonensis]|jgi:hypothetical protein|uniref:Uncharacterized protein n=1 Tax=Roseinatronobacter ekhonensis TaxID=254356 RepID=A0A3B0MK42_9RHOB|nr:hypothetical protein [Roseibaca ekhonensis]SUZ33908.1 hypothetical protein ROE7235_03689 [Roseibaca ekhonensis]